MAHWDFEQWQAAKAARDMARNPFPLLIVGIIVTALTSASPSGQKARKLTAEEYADRAQYCEGRLACQKAWDEIQQAIKLDAQLPRAYVVRGSLLLKRSQPEIPQAAIEDYQKARSLYHQKNMTFEVTEMDKAIAQIDRGKFPSCLLRDPGLPWSCM